ncbi:hypothetical protein ACFX15_023688 [Malus domestica]
MLPGKIPHLPKEQIGQGRRIQGSMWRQAKQHTRRYIHYSVKAKVSHISRSNSALYSRGNQKTLKLSSRISLWKVTSSKAKLGDLGDSYYMVCIALDQA